MGSLLIIRQGVDCWIPTNRHLLKKCFSQQTTMSLSRFLGGRVVLLARARVNSRAGMSTKPNPPALPEFDTAKDIGLLHLWPVLLGVAVITSMSLYVSPFFNGQRDRARDKNRA